MPVQVSNNLLPEWQSAAFIELIRDIVSQLRADPSAPPVLNPAQHSALRLQLDKVGPHKFLLSPDIVPLQQSYVVDETAIPSKKLLL